MTGLLADMFEALSEGIAIFDENACLVTCNRRYKEMLAPVADLIEPGVSWRLINLESVRRGVFTESAMSETQIIDRAEEDLAALVQGSVVDHADGRSYEVSYNSTSSGGFVITRTDVTERRQAEVRLREREALLSTILDTNPTPVVMARLSDSSIVYRSAAARELYGDGEFALAYYSDPEDRVRYVTDLKQTRPRRRPGDPIAREGWKGIHGLPVRRSDGIQRGNLCRLLDHGRDRGHRA